MPRMDSASRVVKTDVERVFAALLDPAQSFQVWLPPAGMTGRFERFDPDPGGSYRLVLTYVDGTSSGKATADSDIVEARFIDIEPNVRVVQAVDFLSDDPSFAGTMTMTWEVSAHPDGAQVTMRAEDVPAGISSEDHVAGMTSSLAQLAAFVEP